MVYPRKVTGFFYAGADVALQTIVAPAANTNGVIVTSAGMHVITDNTRARVMAKASAPTSVDDSTALTLCIGGYGLIKPTLVSSMPCVLPPGVGLYAQKSDANAGATYFCDYEVL